MEPPTPGEQDFSGLATVVWWRSRVDRQVHGFDLSGVDPREPPERFTALCGHVAVLAAIEPSSSGMPCLACLIGAPASARPAMLAAG